MTNFPGMQDPAIIAAVIIAVIAGIFIGCVFTIARGLKHDTWARDPEGVWWFRGGLIAIGLVVLIGYMQERDDRAAATLDRQLARLGCPDKADSDSNLIVLTIDTSADAHTDMPYRATSCTRIVDRGYMRAHREALVKAAP